MTVSESQTKSKLLRAKLSQINNKVDGAVAYVHGFCQTSSHVVHAVPRNSVLNISSFCHMFQYKILGLDFDAGGVILI